ncbi:DUF350 domain-containing protein [Gordonia sp. HNM0687]|uniref:DUF350 domain-containing protein n=1 Tax=Gordonia mangrovi TaxID=2665643 RepID=A0A6L7GV29_9ACTN|nr:DUF350 domain-containing protein [Gordonia mangrovi]MXP23894.1 DUF350 domain-containing protein [Gordonia mangrovi]UVF76446.1 DUF350 domain-containing protein [Gordonia mangrovi]
MLTDIVRNGYAAAAYGATGMILMLLSFAVIDALTPGNLRHLLWADRNRNAGILVGSNAFAVAIIVAAAIVASEGRLVEGLTYTVVYTIIGVAIMTITFFIIDLFTPGKLGELVVHPESHPAVWVHGVVHIGIALIVAVSIL